MATTMRTWTDEELMALPEDGMKRELVDGEIIVSPAGLPHDNVIMRLGARLNMHVENERLGHVAGPSMGWRLTGGNLRVPDLTFISHVSLPGGIHAGFLRETPDLVVEVLSPGDRPRNILDKIGEYLGAGVRRVWIVDPETRSAAIYRSLTDVSRIDEHGALDGEDVVPGFTCRLADVLPPRD